MELTIDQALRQGVAAHNRGNLQKAERIYQAILQSQPKHPDASHNLGLIAAAMGNFETALRLFKIALEVNPKIEQFWLSYVDALIKNNQINDAKRAIKKAKKQGFDSKKLEALCSPSKLQTLGRHPSQTQLNSLAEYYQAGRYGDAEKLAVFITKNFPTHQFGWKVLGAILGQTDRKAEALIANQKTVSLSPQDAEAHCNLGVIFQELGRLKEAEASYKQAIALQPDYAKAHNDLGVILQELGRFDEAEASYKQTIALQPDYAKAHNNLGVTLQELGKLDEAEASYKQAIVLQPDYAKAHTNLGIMLQELGRFDEAEASFKQAIVLQPDYAKAHHYLTIMKNFVTKDEQYLKLQELYFDEKISDAQRCHINFALAKACEDLENFEQAYTHYSEANGLRKKLLNYDISRDIELFNQLQANYPRIEEKALDVGNLANKPMPIFIVGMPRSGTTLVEQIISSHSKVTGAGELSMAAQFGASIARGESAVNKDSLTKFRDQYLTKLQNISNGNLLVTDKMPQNFRFLGLLAATFPEVKIVHVKRNAAAVCWANYKQYFKSKSLGYCYELDDILSYYKLYENLMQFWSKSFSNRIYNLDYELLTVNQKDETRKLIEYLDLDWDDKCLSPQNNKRSVTTASNVQVREKIYQDSSQQWKKYKPFLNGALDYLDG